jgi:hypothetical protein
VTSGTELVVDQPSSLLTKAVSRVQYYLDAKLVATVTTPPYSYKVNTSTLKPGKHTLKSVIYYTDGTTKTTTQQFNIKSPPSKLTATTVGISLLVLAVIVAGLFFIGGLRRRVLALLPGKKASPPHHDIDLKGLPHESPHKTPDEPLKSPVVEFHPTAENQHDEKGEDHEL